VDRYITNQVSEDLKDKMVFVGGPRQVGKTTLALSLLDDEAGYLSWDDLQDRERILKHQLPTTSLIVFDELHKYRLWRNYLKGFFDKAIAKQRLTSSQKRQILVTGSAKLDYYRYAGDSLQGRYHYIRMYPLSVAELKLQTDEDFKTLLTLGGFPEPFFSGSETKAKRWSTAYRNRLINEEITTLESVFDLSLLELLMIRLPEMVASPLSINSLREDLQVSHQTIARWITIFERFYAIVRVPPFGHPKIKAVKKEQKHYHTDWSLVPELGARFENLVAISLLKWIYFEIDTKGRDLELRYFRDIDGREVDFVITENRKPIQCIECKWNDGDLSKGLKYFKTKFPSCEAIQIAAIGKKDYETMDSIKAMPALKYLNTLI
jgi:predicted AAA+ superfamily ATPase